MLAIRISAGLLCLSLTMLSIPSQVRACGGFFCTTVPINQAAEQIVFRQEGNEVTAMVRILYSGNAEDFSWVVPVPDTPQISLGANVTFNELDFATRPQFILQTNGRVCAKDEFIALPVASPLVDAADSEDGGVTIEEELSLGPFDIDIVSSDNADDMSIWLQDNGYAIGDRGQELLEPYILAGMKFVALKLQSGEASGSIQPLIMRYPSEKPMVPIRLTAIAAEEDMGVLVWVVNDARAVPENYEHVTPNYTKLNWYSGSFNAYSSYQTLITDAMNEAGGQGFATDYAGSITDSIHGSLTGAAIVEDNLAQLDTIGDDAQYLVNSLFMTTDTSASLASLQTILPLPDGLSTNVYFDAAQLASTFTPDELRQARIDTRQAIVTRELEPIRNGVDLLPEGAYLTRLYTTLSADEMTVDPSFNYNSSMPEQALRREAQLNASCENDVSRWSLTLGKGTGREGEKVLEVTGQPIPVGVLPTPIDDQPAAFLRQRTSADAAPELLFQAESSLLQIGADGSSGGSDIETDDNDGFLGAFGFIGLISGVFAVSLRRRWNWV
ncbi:MAG: DUF2330 domain-containing protein [Granulosicoccus sp.]